MLNLLKLAALAAALAWTVGAPAQTYPSKPIRWIVPYTPGGITDNVTRVVTQRLQEQTGWNIVVENKPGANSIRMVIAEVQAGTNQAVEAMNAGAVVVEQGATMAAQAGSSLDEIADAVEATQAAVGRITGAVDAMNSASNGVVAASDAIATIAAQTNSAAASMTASADTVSRSVQAIASISEENSASAEEVSAATEEMSAQAEEVVASAATLADMARTLDELVARFRTVDGSGSPSALSEPASADRPASAPGLLRRPVRACVRRHLLGGPIVCRVAADTIRPSRAGELVLQRQA